MVKFVALTALLFAGMVLLTLVSLMGSSEVELRALLLEPTSREIAPDPEPLLPEPTVIPVEPTPATPEEVIEAAMELVDEVEATDAADDAAARAAARSPFSLSLRVRGSALNVRSSPSTGASLVRKLRAGAEFHSDPSSAVLSDGYVWHFHDAGGWSALGLAGVSWDEAFVMRLGPPKKASLPMYGTLFVSSPVDLGRVDWVQYFGDTTFARRYGRAHNYDGYSQGLHGGFDFGLSSEMSDFAVPVFASLEGVVALKLGNQVWVEAGPYKVGYIHLEDIPPRLEVGQRVLPDTFLGNISRHEFPRSNVHLHLEVVYDGRYLVNPAELMPPLPWGRLDSEGYAADALFTDPAAQPLIELSG